ncbi:MAG: hypothetical protein ABIA11_01540 [Patescibacteria group bacterium]
MQVKVKNDVKVKEKTTKLPKLDIDTLLTDETLVLVGGRAESIYAHTDGQKCDTTSGCKC